MSDNPRSSPDLNSRFLKNLVNVWNSYSLVLPSTTIALEAGGRRNGPPETAGFHQGHKA